MATVLVSFIGNGNLTGNEYYSTEYFFENESTSRTTKIFGSVLLKHLIDDGKTVDSWLIMGTKESIWFDLIEVIETPDLDVEETSLHNFLFDNAFNASTDESQISQYEIAAWQEVLNKRIENTKIVCRLVGDATTKDSQELIFDSLDKVIKNGDEVVFDVTHGLRNQPIITSFVLMYLRYAKEINIDNIRFYYASLDSTKTKGKVHQLDFCNKLLEATEAVAVHKQTGNFVRIGQSLKLNQEDVEKVNFSNEMNRTTDRTSVDSLIEELNKKKTSDISSLNLSLLPLVEESLGWHNETDKARINKSKADIAFKYQQYFQAIAQLYESLFKVCCDKYVPGFDENRPNYIDAKKKIRDGLSKLNPSHADTFTIVEYLRNQIMHGNDATDKTFGDRVNEALKDREKFIEEFEKGQELLEFLLSENKS